MHSHDHSIILQDTEHVIPQTVYWEEGKVTMAAGVRRSKSSVSVSRDAVFNHSIVPL